MYKRQLFFQVLARDMGSRTHSIMRDFAYVPYLNSSLFEVTDLESKITHNGVCAAAHVTCKHLEKELSLIHI